MVAGRAALAGLVSLGLGTASAAPTSFSVQSVLVTADGQWHADPNGRQTPAQCARFHLSRPAALRWFEQSHEVTERDWLEQLDWTQCAARGTLVTGDGRHYGWELDQAGRGRVILSPTVSVYLGGRELPFAD